MAANIKIYSPSIDIDKMLINVAPSEASGFPIERALDWNPNTWWKATTTADQDIDLDFGETVTLDSLILFIRNFSVLTNIEAVGVYYSTDDITYTLAGTGSLISNLTSPILTYNFGSQTARYWRISFVNATDIPEICIMILGDEHELTKGNQYPEDDAQKFNHDVLASKAGHRYTRLTHKKEQIQFTRNVVINGTTEMIDLQAAFRNSLGGGRPVAVLEDSNDSLLCYIENKTLPTNELEYQIYNPTMHFITVPYIEYGETF